MSKLGRRHHMVYIANARLPTEKAHGFQICKMCEAFALHRMDVLLMHPYRYQSNVTLRGRSVFDYYGMHPSFRVQTLPNLDIVRLERLLPRSAFTPAFFAHGWLWGLYVTLVARRKQADLYYTRDSNIASWLVRLGLPTIYEAHVVPKRGQRWLLKTMTQNRTLKLVVVLTSFIRSRLMEIGFPAEKVIILPDGVDVQMFARLPCKNACRRRLGLPLDRPIIGYIGRFHTLGMEKGIPELVQAMAHLHAANGMAPLLLCVGGPMDVVPQYLALASRLGIPKSHICFADRVPNKDVPLWVRSFDVAVAPFPLTEHYAYFMSPLKLFEYMAAGVPIVTTDLPSIREILQHRKNAWLVQPGSAQGLAEGIRTVLTDPPLAQNLVQESLNHVRSYTWLQRTHRLLDLVVSGEVV